MVWHAEQLFGGNLFSNNVHIVILATTGHQRSFTRTVLRSRHLVGVEEQVDLLLEKAGSLACGLVDDIT
jgi:hypothetical protein